MPDAAESTSSAPGAHLSPRWRKPSWQPKGFFKRSVKTSSTNTVALRTDSREVCTNTFDASRPLSLLNTLDLSLYRANVSKHANELTAIPGSSGNNQAIVVFEPPSPSQEPAIGYRIASREDLWKNAYKILRGKDPALVEVLDEMLPGLIDQQSSKTVEDTIKLIINDKLKTMEDKQWKLKWGNRSIVISEQLNNILKAINKFKDIGSTLTSLDPTHAGIAWAGIFALLPLIIKSFDQHAAILEGLESISNVIVRYTAIEDIYARKTMTILGADLETAIVKLYSEVLYFQGVAASQFSRGSFLRAARNTWGSDDWSGMKQKILDADRFCFELMGIVQQDDLNSLDRTLRIVDAKINSVFELMIQQQRQVLLAVATETLEQEFDHILPHLREWIDPPAYESDQANILQPQETIRSSSRWILQEKEISNWIDGDTRNVWICGRPGCGKSVLAALITSQLQQRSELSDGEPSDIHVGYVFCQKKDSSKRTPLSVIQILVWQLVARGSALQPEQKRHLVFAWKSMSNPLAIKRNTARAMEIFLFQLLGIILQSFRRTYLVVDGLDECHNPGDVLLSLNALSSGIARVCDLHLLVASQKTSQISEGLETQFRRIDLDAPSLRAKSNDDIDLVTAGILSTSKNPKIIDHVNHLKNSIIKRSDGMILWATIAARHILERVPTLLAYNEDAIMQIMDEIPPGISYLFAYLIQRCLGQEPAMTSPSPALAIFQWTLWSTRPLRLQELHTALCSPPNIYTRVNYSMQELEFDVRHLCSPLITILQDSTIAIVHTTLKEFIQHQPTDLDASMQQVIALLSENRASLVIAETCLKYLNQPCFQKYEALTDGGDDVDDFDDQYTFFHYAAMNWIYHWGQTFQCSMGSSLVVNLFHQLVAGGQGLVWLEGLLYRDKNTSGSLHTLQAEVYRHLGPSANPTWLIDIFQQLLDARQTIFGRNHKPTRSLRNTFAGLLKDSGRIHQAISLYEQLLTTVKTPADLFESHLTTSANLALARAEIGDLQNAQNMLEKVVESYKKTHGNNSYEVLCSMNNLATVYNKQFMHKQAEELLSIVVEKRVQSFGYDHYDTMLARNNLALTYLHLDKYDEAKEIHISLLAQKETKLGFYHPSTLLTKHNLTAVHFWSGNMQEAENLERQVLQVRESMFGRMHSKTLLTLNNLAFTLTARTRYSEAALLLEGSLDQRASLLGPKHPATLTAKYNLACIYQSQRRYQEARELHLDVLKNMEEVYPKDHLSVIDCLGPVAELAREAGQFEKATELQLQVLEARLSVLGRNSSSAMSAVSQLAFTCFERGFLTLAISLQEQQLEARESQQKPKDTVSKVLVNDKGVLGIYKSSHGFWTEAEGLLTEAISEGLRVLGAEHLDYLGARRHLGQNLRRQGRFREADDILVDLLNDSINNRRAPLTTSDAISFQLAWLRYDQERFNEAKTLLEKILKFRQSNQGDDHYLTVQCKFLLGAVFLALEELEAAWSLMEAVLEKYTVFYGPKHRLTLNAKRVRALVLQNQGDIRSAEADFSALIMDQVQELGLWHPDTLKSLENMSSLYQDCGRLEEAVEISKIVLCIREETFGSNHPETLRSQNHFQTLTEAKQSCVSGSSREIPTADLLTKVHAQSFTTRKAWSLNRLVYETELIFGAKHFQTIMARKTRALFDLDRGEFSLAEEPLRRAWKSCEEIYGQEHKITLTSLVDVARCWKQAGTFREMMDSEAKDALFWAVEEYHQALFDLLLAENYSIDVEPTQQATPLFAAARAGYSGMVFQLLDAGAKVSCPPGVMTPLHASAENNHHTVVKYLVDFGAEKDTIGPSGGTALYYASSLGHQSVVRKLLALRADPEVTGPNNDRPLHIAARRGHSKCVELLLTQGADVDASNPQGFSALYLASAEGHLRVVTALLKYNATVDHHARDEKILPLHIAVSNGHLEIVTRLVEKGAALERECFHLTPIHVAIMSGQLSIFEYLMTKGVVMNPKEDSEYGIHKAAKGGFVEILKLMLDNGVDIEITDVDGDTPLAMAALRGQIKCVIELLKHKATVNTSSANGMTPLHHASIHGNLDVVKILVEAGADVQALTAGGYGPLHLAAEKGRTEVVEFLLSKNAEASALTGTRTALQLAICNGSHDVARRLISHGVDVNIQAGKGNTALFLAAASGDIEILILLLRRGAISTIGNRLGLLPLHIACFEGHLEIVRELVLKGFAPVDARSSRGLTSLQVAVFNGHLAVVEFLLSEAADPDLQSCFAFTALSVAAQRHEASIVQKLLPYTKNPLLFHSFGKSCLDWASNDPVTFAAFGDWTKTYTPTAVQVQESRVRETIGAIITALLERTLENDLLFTVLGRCLLILGNELEADHAYQLDVLVALANDERLMYNIACDACSRDKSVRNADIKGDMFVCLECVELSLCAPCMEKYAAGTGQPRFCVKHAFHKVLGRHWKGAFDSERGFVNARDQTLKEWLLSIRDLYVQSGEEC